MRVASGCFIAALIASTSAIESAGGTRRLFFLGGFFAVQMGFRCIHRPSRANGRASSGQMSSGPRRSPPRRLTCRGVRRTLGAAPRPRAAAVEALSLFLLTSMLI
jgi:hypothetical protein